MLSEAQRRALACLAGCSHATPATIGYAMTPDRAWPLKPQGAGRVGGMMAKRLIEKGLAEDASRSHAGFAAYRITDKGRQALSEKG